ncbi:MAG: thioredoxin-dependent thiol peroxidase [Bacteroidota bacterium]
MKTLEQGDKAPDFKGKDQGGNLISLDNFRGKKLVLYFYPRDNTPGCSAEACNLRDNYQDFLNRGYMVVGVSADSEKSHQKFIQKYGLPFPLISDPDLEIIKAYGAWGEKSMYGKKYEGILRKTFIISEDGFVEKIIEKVKTKDHSRQIFEA